MTSNEVHSVHLYPIKSLGEATVNGAAPDSLTVGMTGFEAHGVKDRQWLLDYEGSFVSQRGWAPGSHKTDFLADRSLATISVDVETDHTVVIAPGTNGGTLELSNEITGEEADVTTLIHGNTLQAFDEGPDPARFFSNFLGRPVRLLRADVNHPRLLSDDRNKPDLTNTLLAADGMSFLLANQESLDDLHHTAGLALGTVAMSRYRPNIVVDLEPYAEDLISRLRIGSFVAEVVGPCKRCPIPNIDQTTGVSDGMSNKVLRYRSGSRNVPGRDTDPGLYFGQNLNHQWSPDEYVAVGVGDAVEVIETAPAPNVILRSKG